MKTNQRIQNPGRMAISMFALMALGAGTALAATPSTTAYFLSSHPMISGTVVTVNDHQMVVDTDQGEQIAMEVDSRTMAPRDLAPGMVARVEFRALEDCRFYAERVFAIRTGMPTERLQAYANTRDDREAVARSSPATGGDHRAYLASEAGPRYRESLPASADRISVGPITSAMPATAGYVFSTRPMISGRVVSVNDHRLVVDTNQGQRVAMVMDSRTMVPGEVEPGSVLRTEFKRMQDGRYYAQRITLVEGGAAEREQAYAQTRDSDIQLAQNSSDCESVTMAPVPAATSALERRDSGVTGNLIASEQVAEPEGAQVAATETEQMGEPAASPVDEPAAERPETLPQTASHQPLILLLGLLAVGSAGVVSVVRGRRLA